MKTDNISLSEFLELVFVAMLDKKLKPPNDYEPWHRTLYEAKRSKNCPVKAVRELAMDSDGPHMTCRDFAETFEGFVITGCIEIVFPRGRYQFDPALIEYWRKKWQRENLPVRTKKYVEGFADAIEKSM